MTCGVLAAASGCGADEEATNRSSVAVPPSGVAYQALSEADRTAVAASCRDRAAARADGPAARQLAAVSPAALRDELDAVYRLIDEQRRSVRESCAEQLPFVTPGLRVTFARASGRGSDFTYETVSDRRLTLDGRISPAPDGGRVRLERELAPRTPQTAAIGSDGRFAFERLRLRKLADNTFILSVDAPPNAPRKVRFSAICLDCLAGTPPPAVPLGD